MIDIRQWVRALQHTPLHPQWLLGGRKVPAGVASATGTLLDIGAADRWIRPHLSSETNYVALDYPATGRDLYAAKPDVYADAARLPFAAESFEGVICLEVLEHVPDPAIVISEIARVLKQGGRAWLSMPFLYPLHDAPFDFQRYTEFGLRRDAERAGLQVIQLSKSGHAIRSAGLLMCLAIAGGVHERRGWLKIALLPLALVSVVMVNLVSWLLSLVWPDWRHMAKGHDLELSKP